MTRTDQALFYLPIFGFIFSAVSLGLSAKCVDELEGWFPLVESGPNGVDTPLGETYIRAPWAFKFLIVISAWSILACAGLLAVPKMLARAGRYSTTLGWGTLFINVATMGVWLFVLVNVILVFGAHVTGDINAALETFTVLPWLCFVALAVVNVLTSYGMLESTHPGYPGLYRKYEKTTTPDDVEERLNE